MSSLRRNFAVRHPVVVDTGCGRRRPNLSSLFSSSPKHTTTKTPDPFSPSATTTTSSSYEDTSSPPSQVCSSAGESPLRRRSSKKKGQKKGVVEESEAVVKESLEPYIDFRESMLQMIVEKEIYEWEDLRDLLHRFLALNSPNHHHLIVRAFTEIWKGLLSPP